MDETGLEAELAVVRDRWGTQAYCDELLRDSAPSLFESVEERRWFANWLRVGATPASAYVQNRALGDTDLTEVLPAVRVPTLVLYRPTSLFEPYARDVARLIPDATLTATCGKDWWGIFLSPEIPSEVERFVGGEQQAEAATALGASCSSVTTLLSAESSDASAAKSRTRQAAASSRPSTGRRARFVARRHSWRASASSASRCAPASHGRVRAARRQGRRVGSGYRRRVAAAAGAGEVLVSQTVKDLVAGTGLALKDRGARELKGVPGIWRLYAPTEAEAEAGAASGRSAA